MEEATASLFSIERKSCKNRSPFKKNQGNLGGGYWETECYNTTIKSVKLTNVDIEYIDGTELTISDENDLKYIQYKEKNRTENQSRIALRELEMLAKSQPHF